MNSVVLLTCLLASLLLIVSRRVPPNLSFRKQTTVVPDILNSEQDAIYRNVEDHPWVARAVEEFGDMNRKVVSSSDPLNPDPVPINPIAVDSPPGRTNRRRLLERQQNDDASNFTVIIEGDVQPIFFCLSCRDDIQIQQDSIMANLTGRSFNVEVLATTQRLVNALFVRIEMSGTNTNSVANIRQELRQIQGVQRVMPHEEFQMTAQWDTAGFKPSSDNQAVTDFCVKGKNTRIAVLDSGIDYTHVRFGGPGTKAAYQLAYGTGRDSVENTVLNEWFPTDVVVDGKDFLGDTFVHTANSTADDATPDLDPIDGTPGHGTAVADAIRQVAPDAKLIALKVCTTSTNTCPDFAIAQALEYALDPKGDGSMEGKVDVINLSLGLPHFNPYYDFISKMLEDIFHLGVVPVVAFGNHGNHIPFVAGFASIAPSVISVGATSHPRENKIYNRDVGPSIAHYSARGPGYTNGQIKPDLVAPAGISLAASGSGTGRWASVTGTSFAAPLVAGGVALLKEKCGTACSPFALKSLLMNNVNRKIRSSEEDFSLDKGAPISAIGAGELHLFKALNATFWAYSVEDVQPAISLGVINVASDMTIQRTLRIYNLASHNHSLSFSSEFRDAAKAESNALAVEFQASQTLPGNTADCHASRSYLDVQILFKLEASQVPSNHMTSTGMEADFANKTLDFNEFGGHVIISSLEAEQDISLPFMAILRQASNVTMETSKLRYSGRPTDLPIGLKNHGAGVSQIDSYQVLSHGDDSSESPFGDPNEKVDMRVVGYRVLTPSSNTTDCKYLFEWAFMSWEIQDRLRSISFEVQLDTDGDFTVDYYVFNSALGSIHTSKPGEVLVKNAHTGEVFCSGFHADHHTFSSTTVIRVCSNDLGINNPGSMAAQARVVSVRHDGTAETTDTSPYATMLTFPEAELSAPSYDLYPGEVLESIAVSGSYGNSNGLPPLGLMIVTDAYRRPDSTGAALRGTETLLLLAELIGLNDTRFEVKKENTKENRVIPSADDFRGPDCSWGTGVCITRSRSLVQSALEQEILPKRKGEYMPQGFQLSQQLEEVKEAPSCLQVETPRAKVPTKVPSSSAPSTRPSTAPSGAPNAAGMESPSTLIPSEGPSFSPTFTPVKASPSLIPSVDVMDSPSTLTPSEGPSFSKTTSSAAPTSRPSVVPIVVQSAATTGLPTEANLSVGIPSSSEGHNLTQSVVIEVPFNVTTAPDSNVSALDLESDGTPPVDVPVKPTPPLVDEDHDIWGETISSQAFGDAGFNWRLAFCMLLFLLLM